MPSKNWGVFSHRVRDSRWNEVPQDDLEAAGLHVLVESEVAGLHMAVSPDQFRIVYFQGHPEYDRVSLLKEYKRETMRFLGGEIDAPPPYPEHYLRRSGHRRRDLPAPGAARPGERRGDPRVPRKRMRHRAGNLQQLAGARLSAHQPRSTEAPLMPGIAPEDPLGLRSSSTRP